MAETGQPIPVRGKLVVNAGLNAIQKAGADGFRAGQDAALQHALEAIDGVTNGPQCAERIAIILARLRAGELLDGRRWEARP